MPLVAIVVEEEPVTLEEAMVESPETIAFPPAVVSVEITTEEALTAAMKRVMLP